MVKCLSCCHLLSSTFPVKSELRSCRKPELCIGLRAAMETNLLLHERRKHSLEFQITDPTVCLVSLTLSCSPHSCNRLPPHQTWRIRVSSSSRCSERCGLLSPKVSCGFKKKTGGDFWALMLGELK